MLNITPPSGSSWVALAIATPVVLVGGALALQVAKTCYLQWRWRHIPGPKPGLLLGNLLAIRKAGGTHMALTAWKKEHGPIFKIFFLANMFIVVADPDAARMVLNKCINHAQFVDPSYRLLRGKHARMSREGLLQSRDGLWRRLRSAWQPAFAPASISGYVALMHRSVTTLRDMLRPDVVASQQLQQLMQPQGRGEGWPEDVVDIHQLFSRMTLDVVGTTAFGVEFQALKSSTATDTHATGPAPAGPTLHRACKDVLAVTTPQGATRWGMALMLLPSLRGLVAPLAHTFPDKPITRMMQARQDVLDTSFGLMRDWRSSKAVPPDLSRSGSKVEPTSPLSPGSQGVAPGSFLGLLLDAQQRLSMRSDERLDDITLAGQCLTFLLAGTETTANTLSYAVYLISQRPEVESRLLEELTTHGLGKAVAADDKLPYVDAIINETLRLYPPAHLTTRDVSVKEGITVGGYHLPRGTMIMVPVYALQHDDKLWPRVSEFLPERWLPEHQAELGSSNPAAYCPFGGGPRMCPGSKFGLQEARIALALMYSHYTFQLAPGQVPLQVAAGLTLSPKAGVWVKPVLRS